MSDMTDSKRTELLHDHHKDTESWKKQLNRKERNERKAQKEEQPLEATNPTTRQVSSSST